MLNGESVSSVEDNGYICIDREWQVGDSIDLIFEIPIRLVLAHPNVEDCVGKVALERGPIVYAFEGVDNNDTVADLVLSEHTKLIAEHRPDLLGGVTVLTNGRMTAIPYYAWENRGIHEMAVWLAYGT